MTEVHRMAEHLFRHESGKMLAVLTRLYGFSNYDIARDVVQDTLLAAMQQWKLNGIPDNPTGWLYATAKNKVLDRLRRAKKWEEISPDIIHDFQSEEQMQSRIDQLFLDHEIEDSQLRMMFACCHPSLAPEAQITLILRTLCGLSIPEIAKAFLSNDETVNKRLYRAKEKIRSTPIVPEVPAGDELSARLDAVLKTVYLLFNEGYNSQHPDRLIKQELCDEALRLGTLLHEHRYTAFPKTAALLSLMYFQSSRFDARLDEEGAIVLLAHQNRQRWDRDRIKKGREFLNKASYGPEISAYHLEAAIASYHAQAESFETTNWQAIMYLYRLLEQLTPSITVQFNKAVATGFAEGPQRGLEALLPLKELEKNQYYHTALGDFYVQMQDTDAAKKHYETALRYTLSKAEWQLISKKIEGLP
ncbi:RNA polymerase sigma factor [Runella slithyformis]|uniref:RNA polymerase, sigma-24 subunit, ECF subfamily n=1 Tax=Runella slithyformis (strain ATCC 29530 / DSM 19594 / LMG 11500 / NCIMB 11436 / LSU 4) TaxID=761193 RepID=A0A7U3ZIC4_RUNSL|nr:sigma-70 family RNA polymerase sigma factor [Runella slithyformis]AEI47760.1 putative RNA polymerase, sigma-24 subunit, ECF subfamily [Runella slithyformis DSM 19594]